MDLQAFEIGGVKEINQAREENRCPSIYYTASQLDSSTYSTFAAAGISDT